MRCLKRGQCRGSDLARDEDLHQVPTADVLSTIGGCAIAAASSTSGAASGVGSAEPSASAGFGVAVRAGVGGVTRDEGDDASDDVVDDLAHGPVRVDDLERRHHSLEIEVLEAADGHSLDGFAGFARDEDFRWRVEEQGQVRPRVPAPEDVAMEPRVEALAGVAPARW